MSAHTAAAVTQAVDYAADAADRIVAVVHPVRAVDEVSMVFEPSATIAALSGALVVAGVLGLCWSLRPQPEKVLESPGPRAPRIWSRMHHLSRRTRVGLAAGTLGGLVVALTTGWLLAVVLGPAAAVGLPMLLAAPTSATRIDTLEALEEWTRSLAGVLTVGVGLEQALVATLRSTPAAIAPQVGLLVARLRARWSTEDALRAFAEDLDDATGDLVAANLILGARRRGAGLASVLDGLAESVAADVRARRAIEADRAKPRATARWVTLITIGVLAVLALSGTYVEPYRSPAGQVILATLLATYVGTLIWMKSMATGKPLPRILGPKAIGYRPRVSPHQIPRSGAETMKQKEPAR